MPADYEGIPGSGFAIDEDDGLQTFTFRDGPKSIIDVTAGYVVLAADCGKILINKSGVGVASGRPVVLPAPAAGLRFRFQDQTANGMRIVATGGAFIYNGISISTMNGYLETVIIRQFVTLFCDGTDWHNERDDQSALNIG